jgi:hypothetical protein
MADEILNISTKFLGYFYNNSLGFVKLDELGRVARVDEVLKLTPFQELMPTHEIEIYLVLFILP